MPKAYKCERLHPTDEGVFFGQKASALIERRPFYLNMMLIILPGELLLPELQEPGLLPAESPSYASSSSKNR